VINIVLSNPSRFDKANDKLLCGPAGTLAAELIGHTNFRVSLYDKPSLVPGAPIIFTGEKCLEFFKKTTALDAQRGFVSTLGNGSLAVHTYAFQDASDIKDYESPEDVSDDDDDGGNGKDFQPTRRSNYRFWVRQDIKKLLGRTTNVYRNPQRDIVYCTPAAIAELAAVKDQRLYLDIETHPLTDTLQCLAFAINDGPVISAVIYNHLGTLDPAAIKLLTALSRALMRNEVIVHNGCGFDLPFLSVYHGIPFGRRVYDTMLAGHRIYPEAEKSLGHYITLWANRPFHKDSSGTFNPRSWAQMQNLLHYNMLDVDGMREIHLNQLRQIKGNAGLEASVKQVNKSAYVYALCSITGFRVYTAEQREIVNRNEAYCAQLRRMLKILVGKDLNPGSPKQCAEYFHTGMAYPVLKRSEKTGEPSVGGDVLYRFKLNYPNPVIDVILKLREVEKSTSQLKYKPFYQRKSRA